MFMPQMDEHSRFALFLSMLSDWDDLRASRVEHYLNLALGEPVGGVGEGAVIRLVAHRAVTDRTLDAIEQRLRLDWRAANARLAERRVRLPLEHGLTDEAYQLAAVEQGSRNVQLWLLDNVDLSRAALERLAADGATRAIRNRAAQGLRRI
jgi:hypothetical protein